MVFLGPQASSPALCGAGVVRSFDDEAEKNMRKISIAEAQAGLSGLVDQSQKKRVVLARRGKPVGTARRHQGRDLEEDAGFRALIAERRRSRDA
jgi:hypothetical protein